MKPKRIRKEALHLERGNNVTRQATPFKLNSNHLPKMPKLTAISASGVKVKTMQKDVSSIGSWDLHKTIVVGKPSHSNWKMVFKIGVEVGLLLPFEEGMDFYWKQMRAKMYQLDQVAQTSFWMIVMQALKAPL